MIRFYAYIEAFKLDLQYNGNEDPKRAWRAFQNIHAPACSEGDLYEGYGATANEAVESFTTKIGISKDAIEVSVKRLLEIE